MKTATSIAHTIYSGFKQNSVCTYNVCRNSPKGPANLMIIRAQLCTKLMMSLVNVSFNFDH